MYPLESWAENLMQKMFRSGFRIENRRGHVEVWERIVGER